MKKISVPDCSLLLNVLPVLSFLVILTSCASNKPVTSSHWQEEVRQEKKTLGNNEFNSFSESKMLFRSVNNDKFLQIHVKFIDEDMIRRVMMNGLEIWVDGTLKEKKNTGVQFPSVRSALNGLKPETGKEFDLAMLVNTMSLYGASLVVNGNGKMADSKSATVYLDDNKDLNYIITLPYTVIGTNYLKDKKISLGIISGRMKRTVSRDTEESGENSEGGGRMGHGGEGGYRGGSMGQHGDSQGNQEMIKLLNTWINISLS